MGLSGSPGWSDLGRAHCCKPSAVATLFPLRVERRWMIICPLDVWLMTTARAAGGEGEEDPLSSREKQMELGTGKGENFPFASPTHLWAKLLRPFFATAEPPLDLAPFCDHELYQSVDGVLVYVFNT